MKTTPECRDTTHDEPFAGTAGDPDATAILLVEDDGGLRGGMADRLALAGYTVDTASDAYRAAALLDLHSYDVVISDVELPGHGLSTLGYVRRRQPGTPVILVTGLTDPGFRRRALDNGAFEMLAKPLSGPELVAAVERALEPRNGHDGSQAARASGDAA